MEHLLDLDSFAKALTDKGYKGHFQTEASFPGKLRESIGEYLEACRNKADCPRNHNLFLLSTYLQWSGVDTARIACNLWVRREKDKFDLQKMVIERKDRYGQLLKKMELTGLTTGTVPTLKEAIELVSEAPKQQLSSRNRGFGM